MLHAPVPARQRALPLAGLRQWLGGGASPYRGETRRFCRHCAAWHSKQSCAFCEAAAVPGLSPGPILSLAEPFAASQGHAGPRGVRGRCTRLTAWRGKAPRRTLRYNLLTAASVPALLPVFAPLLMTVRSTAGGSPAESFDKPSPRHPHGMLAVWPGAFLYLWNGPASFRVLPARPHRRLGSRGRMRTRYRRATLTSARS